MLGQPNYTRKETGYCLGDHPSSQRGFLSDPHHLRVSFRQVPYYLVYKIYVDSASSNVRMHALVLVCLYAHLCICLYSPSCDTCKFSCCFFLFYFDYFIVVFSDQTAASLSFLLSFFIKYFINVLVFLYILNTC